MSDTAQTTTLFLSKTRHFEVAMIELLTTIIIFCIVGGLLYWLITLLPLPAPFPQVIQVCVVVIFILLLLGVLFGGVDLPRIRTWH